MILFVVLFFRCFWLFLFLLNYGYVLFIDVWCYSVFVE